MLLAANAVQHSAITPDLPLGVVDTGCRRTAPIVCALARTMLGKTRPVVGSRFIVQPWVFKPGSIRSEGSNEHHGLRRRHPPDRRHLPPTAAAALHPTNRDPAYRHHGLGGFPLSARFRHHW